MILVSCRAAMTPAAAATGWHAASKQPRTRLMADEPDDGDGRATILPTQKSEPKKKTATSHGNLGLKRSRHKALNLRQQNYLRGRGKSFYRRKIKITMTLAANKVPGEVVACASWPEKVYAFLLADRKRREGRSTGAPSFKFSSHPAY
eukprot:SAG22_NODE_331_length_12174_cov_12.920497_5_plen_148_part_00